MERLARIEFLAVGDGHVVGVGFGPGRSLVVAGLERGKEDLAGDPVDHCRPFAGRGVADIMKSVVDGVECHGGSVLHA